MKYTMEELQFAAMLRGLVAPRLVANAPKGLSESENSKWRFENARQYTKETLEELAMFVEFTRDLQAPAGLDPAAPTEV